MATWRFESMGGENTDEDIEIFDEFSAQIKQEESNTSTAASVLTKQVTKNLPSQEKDFDHVSPENEAPIKNLKNEVLVLKDKLSKSDIEKEKAVQENKELREQIKTNKKEFKD